MLSARFWKIGIPVETSRIAALLPADSATTARLRSGAIAEARGIEFTARPEEFCAPADKGNRFTELLAVFVTMAVPSDWLTPIPVGSPPTATVETTMGGLLMRSRMETVESAVLEIAAKP